ncbi:putative plasma membrane proteolipid 3 [Rosellinia necatrix]|uniref:Putative plasma membrane proteolipid 3 n=1 Tax=Rosellinia necatrix TaxID=77044 RepID=A0A1S7UM77_ROSNE|nr:putative plasma membrane proteolipid 3 [Rosellinia necatrix]
MSALSAVLVVLITILFPPAGVAIISGCSVDLFINIALTILGYIPGHIHAFYVEYVYYDRREQAKEGRLVSRRAPGVYSDRVQTGGQNYGTVVQPPRN